ncbi:MAG: hypothetical protein WCI73_12140, partial [Phycisphaerae bacterium]
MKRCLLILTLTLPVLTLWPACATESVSLEDGGEVKMALEDCPPAVQAAIKRAAGRGSVKSVYRDTEGGRETYSATIIDEEQTRAINVSSDGRWVGHLDE